MRENVTEELKQIQPEDESKRQMLDILKRFHLEEEMESDGEDGMFVEQDSVVIAIDSSASLGLCTCTPFCSLLHFRCACHSF
jgi:hypothetical protein